MSFGFSIGDCVLVLQGLVKCTRLLRGEAADGFADHAEAYKSFANGAAYLRKCLEGEEGRTLKPHLGVQLESLKKLLRAFHARIRELKPDLGANTKTKGLRRISRMIRWPVYDAMLSEICHKLSAEFDMIKFIIDLDLVSSIRAINPRPSRGLSRPPDIGPKFVLVDARSEFHAVSLAGVKCWDDLATFIENVFCADGRSCLAVKRTSYLLRNNTTEETFLLNSPSVTPWNEAIKNGDEVEMSVLFPNHMSYNDFCPKCKECWSSPLSVDMFCTKCGLSARFLDSFDDEPDPITSIALRDARRKGLRAFFEESVPARGVKSSDKSRRPQAVFEDALNANIRLLETELGPRPQTPVRHDRSRIKDFQRIVLCNEQWPDLAKAVEMVESSANELRTVIQSLRLLAELLCKRACVLDSFESIIGSRMGGGRGKSESRAFLQSIVGAYTDRQTLWLAPEASLSLLKESVQRTRDAKAQFHASAIRLRCLLWIYSETLTLNVGLLRGCCDLFNCWAVPEGVARYSCSNFENIFSALFIPHAIFWRLTFDLAADAAALFGDRDPVQILTCLPLLVKDAAKLSVAYHLDGNLTAYFQQASTSQNSSVCQLNQASRGWMESTLQLHGHALADDSTTRMVHNAIYR